MNYGRTFRLEPRARLSTFQRLLLFVTSFFLVISNTWRFHNPSEKTTKVEQCSRHEHLNISEIKIISVCIQILFKLFAQQIFTSSHGKKYAMKHIRDRQVITRWFWWLNYRIEELIFNTSLRNVHHSKINCFKMSVSGIIHA